MDYAQTVDFLYTQLPMFSKIGQAAFKKDLTNTIKLCAFLGNPQEQIKTIHIAGTNGKGSTAHALASIFQSAGYKTGLYTSPHIVDFRERIKINGQLCSEQFVIETIDLLKPIIAEIQPSFFEITVAMAFYYFAKQKVDIAIIETGLGGRLDSTNIIQPLLSIITNISYDHQSILGNTLAEITNEKAGIIKCKTPAIIGRNQPEIRNVFEAKAKNENAPLFFADELIQVDNYTLKDGLLNIDFVLRNTKEKEMICTDLNAVYQIENMKTVFAAMLVYNQFYEAIPMSKIKAGLLNVQQQTNFGGRWQVISTEPKIVVDVGHNEDGIVKIIEQLKLEKYEHLHLIYSAVKDKDVDKIIRLLPANATYYLTEAKLERKMPFEILQDKFNAYNLSNYGFENATLALQAAKKNANKLDLILVVGSFFILEDILQN